ncbi:hypothetical protein [Methanoculleus sp.]|uniref:hypothetical protein n=1 Tax=Methanoculleus sp. TaxID=90427 RepID=UPI001BD3C063|nr:hypothetical protein [Methanoculleus sp.]
MVADEITRIKEAEREAIMLVAEASSRAEGMLQEARVDREAILGRWKAEAEKERERILEEALAAARSEAERIRRGGAERAEALRRETQARIPDAVAYVLSRVRGE